LPQLDCHFGDRLRYVHVIRNGVHMAHSRNQNQPARWGPRFGIAATGSETPARASLDYWIAANELALARGRAMPPGSFLEVNYDALCEDPEHLVPRIVEFLRFDPPAPVMDYLISLPSPRKPRSMSQSELQGEFGDERLRRVRALGFSLEEAT
jgi:hypothetical protein